MRSQIRFFCTPTYRTETSFLVNIDDWGKSTGAKTADSWFLNNPGGNAPRGDLVGGRQEHLEGVRP